MTKYISRAGKKMFGSGIEFSIDVGEVVDVLGAVEAMTRVAKGGEYIDAVVDVAFKETDERFNTEAAAFAASTGSIAHMYEWGTLGINKGRTNMRLPPSNPAARLWESYTIGHGLDRTLEFAFKPSMAIVPKPTTGETGMSQEVISKLRDYTFKWKAEVFENGEYVTIAPKKAKFLLMPAYEQYREQMRPNDIKRGYRLLQNPITFSPGKGMYAGEFEAFWDKFWLSGPANDLLEEYTVGMMVADFEPEFRARRTYKTIRKVGQFSMKAEVSKAAAKTNKKVAAKAKHRRAVKK